MSDTARPIFFDPSRRRAAYLSRTLVLAGLALTALLAIFVASLLVIPALYRVRLRPPRFLPDNPIRAAASLNGEHSALRAVSRKGGAKAVDGLRVPGKAAGVVGAFFVNWDEVSLASLRQHAGELTHLFPGWLHLDDNGNRIRTDDRDPSDIEARRLAREHHLQIVPLLNNFSANVNDFEPLRLHRLLTDAAKRRAVIAQIKGYLLRGGYQGVNVDLETDDEDDRALLPAFTAELARALHPTGLLVTQDVQVGDTHQAASIARSCDFVVPMIYDLHYATGTAGPIAPETWAQEQLNEFLQAIPADKTVLALGNYAYDWERGKEGAHTLTFSEALATARESRDGDDGIARFDPASHNPMFRYEEEGKEHEVWFLDAVTAYNFQKFAGSRGVTGRALWYIGSEDPTLWSFFGKGRQTAKPSSLESVHYGFEIDFEGEGELLDVAATPQEGRRTLRTGVAGYITDEAFVSYPSTYIVRRSGWRKDATGHLDKKIALTFDDGPDPQWTPTILDALKAENIPATFFVIGQSVELHPDLAARMWREGHDVGNHSFSHPNLSLISPEQARLELGATQRAIQSAIGRSTPLFRPPYGVDVQPSTADELKPILAAEKLGYITVSEGIDPKDWNTDTKPTASGIADAVITTCAS